MFLSNKLSDQGCCCLTSPLWCLWKCCSQLHLGVLLAHALTGSTYVYLLKVMLQCRFYNLPGLSNCWMVPAEELVPHILQCRLQLAVWFPSPINCTVCHVQLTVQFAICNKLYSLLCPAVQFAICNKLYSLPCPVTVQFAMSSKLYSLQSPRFVGVCFQ